MQIEILPGVVRPRVFDSRTKDGEAVLLSDAVASLLEKGERGCVALTGPPGIGKSTALRFIALTFKGHPELRIVDGVRIDDCASPSQNALEIRASEKPDTTDDIAQLRLAPWGRDEVIEYLLASYKDRCAELLGRFESGIGAIDLGGNPELICITLEEMTQSPHLSDVVAAIRSRFETTTPEVSERERLRFECLLHQIGHELERWTPSKSILRLGVVRDVLAADALVHELEAGTATLGLECFIPSGVREAVLIALRSSTSATNRLSEIADMGGGVVAHNAMELLNGIDSKALARWLESRLTRQLPMPSFDRLQLPGVDLEGRAMPGLLAMNADLSQANLSGCDLSEARLTQAVLNGAHLRGAGLRYSRAEGAQFEEADLRESIAEFGKWDSANLRQADLRSAHFQRTSLRFASLESADLTGADFSGADLTDANVEFAVLVDADFCRAKLNGVKLRLAHLASRRFASASLESCWLDGVVLDRASFGGANLSGASMTGARMRNSGFEGADLQGAGLADIDLEGSDLRRVNLRHASFHMGSTRSGLVFAAPMEGSRTGFYSDEYLQAGYKAPEEIRKANLCRVDLRGAHIVDTDFYLVDLRGARYDAEQALHLRRCGAILDGWSKR